MRCIDDVGPITEILVLDEIDQLIKEERFAYNILEWIQLSTSKIILIFITNMADVDSKLSSKNRSRMKCESLIFKPYNYHQIK